ncbi:MAG: hypothetical protein ABIO49_16375 [Dokdonella sp.]
MNGIPLRQGQDFNRRDARKTTVADLAVCAAGMLSANLPRPCPCDLYRGAIFAAKTCRQAHRACRLEVHFIHFGY